MAISTFDELVTTLKAYLVGDNIDDIAPTNVTLTEANFNRTIRHRRMETRADVTTTPDDPYLITPLDFLEPRSVRIKGDSGYHLEWRSADSMPTTPTTGKPKFFALIGSEYWLSPTPDAEYELELVYTAKLPPLSASNQTNWLLTQHPDVYLYGCLVTAAPYLQDPDKFNQFVGILNGLIQSVNDESKRAVWNPGPMRVRPDITVI